MFMFFFFFTDETNNAKSTPFDNIALQPTANKGEWSELYTLYKLIVDQNLFPIAKGQEKGERLRMPILSILRYTEENLGAEYRIDDDGKNIHINANGYDVIEIEKTDFDVHASELLEAIKRGSKSASFGIPVLDEFRTRTCCPKIKCFSKTLPNGVKDKSDLYIVIHDAMTGQTPKLGFSIKSELGTPPTLLNASLLTNFRYKLSHNLPQDKVDEINTLQSRKDVADIQGRVRAIIDAGASLEFDTINPNKTGEHIFLENLILIDSSMPEILARLLVLSYTEDSKMLNVLTEKLTSMNPLNFPMRTNKKYYEAKVKRFITDVALGMLPGQPWEAAYQAAGVLVVKESGDIDCYHVIYKSSLEDYLYDDLKFETPSAKRHEFGLIEMGEDGSQYFTLNLQLRFIK
jgi:type II restriction enzyme